MNRLSRWARQTFGPGEPSRYQSLAADEPEFPTDFESSEPLDEHLEPPAKISVFEYGIFLLLGVAMLWAWNMFMACATYFQSRFTENKFIYKNFQSFIILVSTITNLASIFYLSHAQKNANYPYRISISLTINCVVFAVLALSTVTFHTGAVPYLIFTLICVFFASMSTGFSQNGVFAFANRFGGMYTQAIMTGQGIAGVLPAIAQIISVLAIPHSDTGTASSKSALAYFLTAVFVTGVCLFLFLALLSRHNIRLRSVNTISNAGEDNIPASRKSVSLWALFKKLKFFSFALWLCFCITMVFPVFTQAIVSIRGSKDTGRLFQPDVFIPWGFLLWNAGDLAGRVICGWEMFTTKNGMVLAAASVARIAFIPLYFLCNINGQGATVESDVFYWVVQLAFGVSNGWIGSNCMMAAPDYVDDEEKEACGGFMGLCLVVGLATGSLLSFVVLNV